MGKFASFGGGFADVHKGDWNGSAVAIKRLRVYSDDPQEKRQQMKKTLFREALIWCTMKHRNILPLVGVCVSDALSPFLMVSPWMENGNIVRYTTIHKTSQQVIDAMLREVAAGLEYLHAHGLVHGDVRGANVLVDQYMHPRIADFGLAHLSDMAHSNSGSGSARWMAPELHDPQAFGLEHPVRTRQSDFFAFGMLCLEVSSGQLPFSHLRTDGAALLAIVRGERPKRPLEENRRMSDVLWTWASCCWSHRPGDRPSMKELLEDSVHDIECEFPLVDFSSFQLRPS
ncbi:kinase-like protein [Neolentinus lepideus HHB14362 ss-1]|uniref:Kinase-like protein n=1 Tax=Neolentinus lepideus HHB14362 ss-1 TaxID=1314782 RepID=A0A165MR50_9AGAM|nr:kinase-like protein [Neolentinus lepideus HHB14362 ss-1]